MIPVCREVGVDPSTTAQPERRRDRARPPVRDDRRAHHEHAPERADESGKSIGLETMCVGGGQGMAMIIERL